MSINYLSAQPLLPALTNLSELLYIYNIIVAYSLFLSIEYNLGLLKSYIVKIKINTVKCYKSVNKNTMYYI